MGNHRCECGRDIPCDAVADTPEDGTPQWKDYCLKVIAERNQIREVSDHLAILLDKAKAERNVLKRKWARQNESRPTMSDRDQTEDRLSAAIRREVRGIVIALLEQLEEEEGRHMATAAAYSEILQERDQLRVAAENAQVELSLVREERDILAEDIEDLKSELRSAVTAADSEDLAERKRWEEDNEGPLPWYHFRRRGIQGHWREGRGISPGDE